MAGMLEAESFRSRRWPSSLGGERYPGPHRCRRGLPCPAVTKRIPKSFVPVGAAGGRVHSIGNSSQLHLSRTDPGTTLAVMGPLARGQGKALDGSKSSAGRREGDSLIKEMSG